MGDNALPKTGLVGPAWAAQGRKSSFGGEDGRFRSCKWDLAVNTRKVGLETWGSDRPPGHRKALKFGGQSEAGGVLDQDQPLKPVPGLKSSGRLFNFMPICGKAAHKNRGMHSSMWEIMPCQKPAWLGRLGPPRAESRVLAVKTAESGPENGTLPKVLEKLA